MAREYTGENCVRPDGFTFRNGVTKDEIGELTPEMTMESTEDEIIRRMQVRASFALGS